MSTLKNEELQSLVKQSIESDAAFFDTAERYGSNMKAAFGVSSEIIEYNDHENNNVSILVHISIRSVFVLP